MLPYLGFGMSSKERCARTDQSLDIIRRTLAGETVTFKSDFIDLQNVKVTPNPSRNRSQRSGSAALPRRRFTVLSASVTTSPSGRGSGR